MTYDTLKYLKMYFIHPTGISNKWSSSISGGQVWNTDFSAQASATVDFLTNRSLVFQGQITWYLLEELNYSAFFRKQMGVVSYHFSSESVHSYLFNNAFSPDHHLIRNTVIAFIIETYYNLPKLSSRLIAKREPLYFEMIIALMYFIHVCFAATFVTFYVIYSAKIL